jgi:hypothetical protein
VFRVLNSSVLSLVVDGKSAGLFRANLAFLWSQCQRESPSWVAVLAARRDLTDSHRHTNAFVDWCLAAAKPAVHLCIRAVHQRVPRLGLGTRSNYVLLGMRRMSACPCPSCPRRGTAWLTTRSGWKRRPQLFLPAFVCWYIWSDDSCASGEISGKPLKLYQYKQGTINNATIYYFKEREKSEFLSASRSAVRRCPDIASRVKHYLVLTSTWDTPHRTKPLAVVVGQAALFCFSMSKTHHIFLKERRITPTHTHRPQTSAMPRGRVPSPATMIAHEYDHSTRQNGNLLPTQEFHLTTNIE